MKMQASNQCDKYVWPALLRNLYRMVASGRLRGFER